MAVRRWSVALLIATWLFFALPFVAVGPNDVEDFYTAVATTKMAIESMAQGAWPFWNMDSTLGVPQPFRFHFITHPLSPLCHAADCAEVLRGIAALHILLGAVFMLLLVRRLTSDEAVATLAGVTFMLSSSIVQTTYIDDWSTTAIRESSLPVLIYAGWALLNATERREMLKWTLVLGGVAGFLVSMSFPFAVFAATTTFFLVQPTLTWSRRNWMLLAAAVGIVICAGHAYHLVEQYRLMPSSIRRDDHSESSPIAYVWSTFLRPIHVASVDTSWRTIFFGGPLAVAAVGALVGIRQSAIRPFKLALLVSLALMCVPERWLFNLMTQRWGYRTGVDMFGIVLGACAIAAIRRVRRWTWIANGAMALQAVVIVAAFWPLWIGTTRAWAIPREMEDGKRVRQTGGVAADLVEIERTNRGRVAFAPNAYDLTRRFLLARDGLVPNLLQMDGVPSLYAETHGITTDALSPMEYAFIGMSPPTATTVTNAATLDVLGIRYVLAMPRDVVADGLQLVRTSAGGVQIYENSHAWPEAFFVAAYPRTPLPRLADCGHDRLLCADFGRAGIEREAPPITVERHPDRMTLKFAPEDRQRHVIVTQWYQPYWRVIDGGSHLVRAGEEFIGLDVPAGDRSVTIEYLPMTRATLFFVGIAAEFGVLALVAWLSLARAKAPLEAVAVVE